MKLTDTFVKRRQGNGKVQKHSDGGGLFLYITPEGKKSWRLAYRFLGKQKLLVIGPYPSISLKDARDTGKELFYSTHDEKAHGVALANAALKWEKNITQENGKILFHKTPMMQREQDRGWSR